MPFTSPLTALDAASRHMCLSVRSKSSAASISDPFTPVRPSPSLAQAGAGEKTRVAAISLRALAADDTGSNQDSGRRCRLDDFVISPAGR